MKYISLLFYSFLVIIFLTTPDPNGNTNIHYVVTSLLFLIYFIISLIKGIKHPLFSSKYPYDFFPLIWLLLWLYAAIIGVVNRAPLYNTIFNFPGMLLILLYYLFRNIDIDQKRIYIIINVSSFVTGIFLVMNLENLYQVFPSIFLQEIRYLYSATLILNILSINFILLPSRELRRLNISFKLFSIFSFFQLFSLIVLLLSISKGYYLSLLISFLLIAIKRVKWNFTSIFVFLIVGIASSYFIYTSNLLNLFDLDLVQNELRSEQAFYLKRSFTWFGNGMGTLIDGYDRGHLGFAFELSYYNVLHKFGYIAGGILFSTYIINIIFTLRRLFSKDLKFESILSVSILSYLITSAGNPLLFLSLNVILHVVFLLVNRRDHVFFKKVLC